MMNCTLKLSVSQFAMLFWGVKTAGLLTATFVIMLFALHAGHSILMLFYTILTAIGSALLTLIHADSAWNWLRYLNLVTFIQPLAVLGEYKNLSFFGQPVNLLPLFFLFAAAAIGGLAVAVYLSFVRKYSLENNLRLFQGKKLPAIAIRGGWRWYEFRKFAFTNKAFFFLIVFALLQGYSLYHAAAPSLGYEHYYFKYMMQNLEGPLDGGKEAFLFKEKAKFEEAERELDILKGKLAAGEIEAVEFEAAAQKHQDILAEKPFFEQVYRRYEYVRDTPGAQFLYDTGYARLFGLVNPDEGLSGGMKILVVILLGLCDVFALEYRTGMYKVLNTTGRGHRPTIRLKLLLSGLFTGVIFILAYLPDLVYTVRFFGMPGLTMPLISVAPNEMGSLPVALGSWPIWSYIVLLFAIRLFVCLLGALLILGLSLSLKNNILAALCGAVLLLFPLVLHLLGVTIFDSCSLLRLLTVNPLFISTNPVGALLLITAYFLLALVSGLFIKYRFGKI